MNVHQLQRVTAASNRCIHRLVLGRPLALGCRRRTRRSHTRGRCLALFWTFPTFAGIFLLVFFIYPGRSSTTSAAVITHGLAKAGWTLVILCAVLRRPDHIIRPAFDAQLAT